MVTIMVLYADHKVAVLLQFRLPILSPDSVQGESLAGCHPDSECSGTFGVWAGLEVAVLGWRAHGTQVPFSVYSFCVWAPS